MICVGFRRWKAVNIKPLLALDQKRVVFVPNVNNEQALGWINVVVDPNMGRVNTFSALSTKAGLLAKLNKKDDADKIMQAALENATVLEMHGYGRQLLAEKKVKEAMVVFEKNHKKYKGAWPTNVGMVRGLSAIGRYNEALKYADAALADAPDQVNKDSLISMIAKLKAGQDVNQPH